MPKGICQRNTKILPEDIILHLGWSKKLEMPLMKILNKVKCHPIYALNGVEVYKRIPRTLQSWKNSQNRKKNFKRSYKAPAKQGTKHANQCAA
jgi:hypothetical protein